MIGKNRAVAVWLAVLVGVGTTITGAARVLVTLGVGVIGIMIGYFVVPMICVGIRVCDGVIGMVVVVTTIGNSGVNEGVTVEVFVGVVVLVGVVVGV